MRLIGLDVGTKRIGVAKADTSVRIAVPDGFVMVNGQEFSEIARIARLYNSKTFIVGLPRNNHGEETAQSAYVRNFARTLAQTIPGSRIYFQDESLTSVEAERRLKSRKGGFAKGDIDAEAAAIILQDCIEHFTNKTKPTPASRPPKSDIGDIWAETTKKEQAMSKPSSKTGKIVALVAVALLVLLGGAFYLANHWYNSQLLAVQDGVSCEDEADAAVEDIPEGCQIVKFSVRSDETVEQISHNLYNQDLIRNAFAFQLYTQLSGYAKDLKVGEYSLRESMSTPEIVKLMVDGDSASNVFNFTILPGETIASIQQKLIAQGYTAEAVEAAFAKDYRNESPHLKTLLASKPEDASLEGYLFGETYQFYNDESVENIIIRALEQLYDIVESNNLIAAYEAHNLTLHEGLTLASIVQKEAKTDDQPGVAAVFYNRLHQGIMLGSDVTASYAADLLDPVRQTYTDNAAILDVDSPYNTRKYAGLPPAPICNPGISALLAVANPTQSSYLYFLTGDDGVVYYSDTEDEHNQNIADHCQELCNIGL